MAVVDGKDAAVLGIDLLQQLRELPQGMGAEYQIHMAVGLSHLVRHPLLLSHAAAQADDLAGIGLFRVGQGAEVAVHSLLRVLAHGAGIQHHHVGLESIVGKGKAHLAQHAHQVLAVGHVLLAAEGVHIRQGRVVQRFGKVGADFLFNFPLTRQTLRGNNYVFTFQKTFSCLVGALAKRRYMPRYTLTNIVYCFLDFRTMLFYPFGARNFCKNGGERAKTKAAVRSQKKRTAAAASVS